MIIRKAERKDIPRILDLYAQLESGQHSVLSQEGAEAVFHKMELYPDYSVYVAESGGEIVGTFALAVMDNMAHMGAPSGLVEDVVVSEPLRGKGIGRQMMEFAMGLCRRSGCYKMSLSSNLARVDAHRFYKNLGFAVHGYSFLVEL